jgi:drug/metabolite transporter (DMT)-like permease
VLGVVLSIVSAVLFGSMSIALGFAVRRNDDAEAGAFVTAVMGFLSCAIVAVAGGEWGGDLRPFLLAGLLAPGGSQLLFVLAVRESGPARASVIAGAAPLVAVTIALVALDEPLRAPLIVGALLIVVGGLALAAERVRPDRFRAIGLAFAFGCTLFFATRDNIVRWLASDSDVAPQLAASATIVSGAGLLFLYLVVVRRTRLPRDLRRAFVPYAPAGLLWGASYATLFEAFYRAPVSVVSPLVATESLFAVLFAVLLLRRSELVGRHLVTGALLIVAGGALIGAFR